MYIVAITWNSVSSVTKLDPIKLNQKKNYDVESIKPASNSDSQLEKKMHVFPLNSEMRKKYLFSLGIQAAKFPFLFFVFIDSFLCIIYNT